MSEFKCTLWPSGEVIDVNSEETLLSQLKKAGKKIKSSCGGCATCSDCVVVVKSGELNLSSQTFEELRLLGNVFHITKERLSCQTKPLGDITLDISNHEKNTFTGKNEKASTVSKSTTVKLKKREEVEKSVRENEEKSREKPAADWYRHWEKKGDASENKPKKLGGNKRPRAFSFNESDNDDNKKS
jgi:ferredoxin, 2Fe-2S